jgi:SH3-like domain-containing protein
MLKSFSFFASIILLALAPLALAQDAVQVQPTVENSRFQFSGVINSPDVYVRSGPGEAWYSTMKVPQGAPVTVVGIKYDWLKVLPPEGSFCYVSKLYVERRGDGSVGRVTRSDINVRAGSDLSAVKTTVLAKLNLGDDVKIVGEQDEYYKIAPPDGTFLYVNKQFVTPGKALAVNAAPIDPVAMPLVAETADPTTRPSDDTAVAQAPAPATQPAIAAGPSPADLAETSFQSLESEFAAASKQPLEQQPIADLAKRYEAMCKDENLSLTDQQTAGFRLAILQVRESAQERLAEVAKLESQAAARNQTLKAEQSELEQRLATNEVRLFAAVGTLEASSLQYGAGTLYRLTDPANGRTVIYVRGDDSQAVKLMGQFVGVRGDAVTDDRLNIKVIPFTAIETVDPAQVNGKVIAGIIPPSLMTHAVQASAAN